MAPLEEAVALEGALRHLPLHRREALLRALQADEMSAVYENKFFQNVDRMYAPPHVAVRLCEDSEYRTICPFAPRAELRASARAELLPCSLSIRGLPPPIRDVPCAIVTTTTPKCGKCAEN